jgi:hypothetical protein
LILIASPTPALAHQHWLAAYQKYPSRYRQWLFGCTSPQLQLQLQLRLGDSQPPSTEQANLECKCNGN